MEEVTKSIGKCGGLLMCTPPALKALLELVRALRDRLHDSQSNLKPVAASIIGSIFSKADLIAQAKLAKVAFPPLIIAAMNDNRKPMREACLSALSLGTQKSEFEGGGVNQISMTSFISPFTVALEESEYKVSVFIS